MTASLGSWKSGPRNVSGEAVFYEKTQKLADAALEILEAEQPMTVRGLLYALVSEGALPSTDNRYYAKVKRLPAILRERRVVPFEWLVDHVRETLKPSSWSGLTDFADTVRERKQWHAMLGKLRPAV